MMRVAQLVEPRRFEILQTDLPEPGEGQLLFEVHGCGVCGSNLPPWRGLEGMGYPLEPGQPGHEAWGEVTAVGPGVSLRPGQRIAALSYNAFADHDLARDDAVVPLPPDLQHAAVPGEPLACAVNVARRAGVREGDVVVVLGIGFLGALLLTLLRDAGPSRILAVSRRGAALRAAEAMGADEVLDYDGIAARVDALTGGAGADVVVEATGKARPLELGGELCRVRGRLVVAGYHQDGPRRVNMQRWNWKGLDVINAHERDPAVYVDGMREGIARLGDGRLDLEPLLTHRVPLADIDRAFRLAEERDEDFFKAVVVPERRA